jgi:hypothetical protein
VAKKIHQGVDANVGVGQFGGKGVSQAVHQGTASPAAVDAGTAECA